jgi:hypothetical protein
MHSIIKDLLMRILVSLVLLIAAIAVIVQLWTVHPLPPPEYKSGTLVEYPEVTCPDMCIDTCPDVMPVLSCLEEEDTVQELLEELEIWQELAESCVHEKVRVKR